MNFPSFTEVRRALVATLYGFAHSLDRQFYQGAGARFLQQPDNTDLMEWPDYDAFDPGIVGYSAQSLENVYRYAFFAEYSCHMSDDEEDGNIGRLSALQQLTWENSIVNGWLDESTDLRGRANGLIQMVNLALARHALDFGGRVNLDQIALLAGLDVKVVRNALSGTGESRLTPLNRESRFFRPNETLVDQQEALRWLRGTRRFCPTVRAGHLIADVPQSLSAEEFMPFFRQRLEQLWGSINSTNLIKYETAGRYAAMSGEDALVLFNRPFEEITEDDCVSLSRMIEVDTRWVIKQYQRARSGNETQGTPSVINPSFVASPFNEHEGTLDARLTDAGLRNGYFDLEYRYACRFFPSDCFGSRGAGDVGHSIELHHDLPDTPYVTDMRRKSEALVSPRKRFSAYFSAHNAKAGDIVRFKRIAERVYTLTFLQGEQN